MFELYFAITVTTISVLIFSNVTKILQYYNIVKFVIESLWNSLSLPIVSPFSTYYFFELQYGFPEYRFQTFSEFLVVM